MKDSDGVVGSSSVNFRLFTAIKYLVYLLLSFNVYLFLQEELSALEHTFVDGFERPEGWPAQCRIFKPDDWNLVFACGRQSHAGHQFFRQNPTRDVFGGIEWSQLAEDMAVVATLTSFQSTGKDDGS